MEPQTMERASKVIRQLTGSGEIITPEQMAIAVWPEAIGPKIAPHTRPAKLVRNRLVVEVPDATWQKQLFALTPFVLRNLAKALGPGLVDEIQFRVVPRRREPERAISASPSEPLFHDDADSIADPVLRGIYKVSRKKALA